MKWVALVLCLFLSACGSHASKGRLVIAGGAVKADNELVYGEFMRGLKPDAIIGIVPTASASAVESAASSARTLERYAAGRRIIQLDLPSDKPANAFDPAIVAQIDQCSALWFTGGVQSRILRVFRSASGDSPAYGAMKRLLARGGTIGGTSAGAAMMSDPMITGGTSEDALLGNFRVEDEDSGLGLGRGMGFFPYGLTDQHFLRRGRIGRLIVALEQTGVPRGYGVEENSAIVADLTSGTLRVCGSAVLVDMAEFVRENKALAKVRVSLLQTGDEVVGPSGRVELRAESASWPEGTMRATGRPEAWAAGALEAGLADLAAAPERPVELRSKGFIVRLEADQRTQFAGSPAGLRVREAKLSILPQENGSSQPVRSGLGLSRD